MAEVEFNNGLGLLVTDSLVMVDSLDVLHASTFRVLEGLT